MLSRMMIYHAFLHYQKKMPIRQFVIYVGRDPLHMEHQLQTDALSYRYGLIDLKSFPYEVFLASGHSEEVVLAILADLGGQPGELIAEKIIATLQQRTNGTLEMAQRTLQLVRLAVLRNLGTNVFNAKRKMPITVDFREDALYQEGYKEGYQESRQEAALYMLREKFSDEVVIRITGLPPERVAQLRQQLDTSA